MNELQSSDESGADGISTDIENHYCNMMDSNEDSESLDQKSNVENSDSIRKPKTNIFYTALSPKERKIRDDKLDLGVVRDFCHDICRLDTFASAKVYIHNYDGTFSYHQVHVRSQSIKYYYDIFQKSPEYNNWQKENLRVKRKGNTVSTTIPTIKLRIFANAFCPIMNESILCINQKQRDCANHIQINYYNSLKAIANLRRYQGISIPMKSCLCNGHRNENYLKCHISSSAFMDAVLCPKKSIRFCPQNQIQLTVLKNRKK